MGWAIFIVVFVGGIVAYCHFFDEQDRVGHMVVVWAVMIGGAILSAIMALLH